MMAKRANGRGNDYYSKEFDMRMSSWRHTCWHASADGVRPGGGPAGVDIGLPPGGVLSSCVNNRCRQRPTKWLRDKKTLAEMNSPSRSIGSGAGVHVSGASRGFFDACSGVGTSSRGRLLAGSLGVVLIKERGTKKTRTKRNGEKEWYEAKMGTYSGSLRRH